MVPKNLVKKLPSRPDWVDLFVSLAAPAFERKPGLSEPRQENWPTKRDQTHYACCARWHNHSRLADMCQYTSSVRRKEWATAGGVGQGGAPARTLRKQALTHNANPFHTLRYTNAKETQPTMSQTRHGIKQCICGCRPEKLNIHKLTPKNITDRQRFVEMLNIILAGNRDRDGKASSPWDSNELRCCSSCAARFGLPCVVCRVSCATTHRDGGGGGVSSLAA